MKYYIFHHNIDFVHHLVPKSIPSMVSEFGLGLIFGLVAVLLMMVFKKIKAVVKPAKKEKQIIVNDKNHQSLNE